MQSLCDNWEFTEQWSETFLRGEDAAEPVRLPHSPRQIPLHYASPADYEMVCGYRRTLYVPMAAKGKRLFLQFDGAAHIADVYVNQKLAGTHRCGYTSFRVEITVYVNFDAENQIAVRLDSTENGAIPPFGFVIDYLTYGGLYREAWLDVRPRRYVEDVFVTTPDLTHAHLQITRTGNTGACRVRILDESGVCAAETVTAGAEALLEVSGAKPWMLDAPVRYTCEVSLLDDGGAAIDTTSVWFGFRTAQFRADGFYLNGEKTFLCGLNRHQSYPWIGYAAPEQLQRQDARILKYELSCNAVRTSHYPQSQSFIDECDRIGLLVFTEIPGWQHIGDASWKKQAVENTREMVMQYRNHPSVILWGVRINESLDDDAFYRPTNAAAHELDHSRATSGVRYLEKSHLLEDVYAYNDFSYSGANSGAKKKRSVMREKNRALLISEHNGHMFPTKSYDPWAKRQEHALRHARVLEAAMASGEHAGCFGWCMFDYPTHKDFGSGDRVCDHGVMDTFRNPKLAASLYAAQGESQPVLDVGSSMDIGDYPAGQLGSVYVFTNAETVELYKNDQYVTTLSPGASSALPHPPMCVSDTIGCLLQTQEGFDEKKAAVLRKCLLSAGKYGLAGMPLGDKLQMGLAMLRYHMTFDDGVALYGKYVSNWGGEATRWRFEAKRGGKTVASVTRAPGSCLHLEVRPSHTALCEGASYDMASVRIRVLDEYGNPAPYAQLPVRLTLTGAAALACPETVCAEGGMCGAYVRTTGRNGTAQLIIETDQTEPVTVAFTITAARREELSWN